MGIELNSADDYLGPAAERFFGAGYRRVEYSARGTGLTPDGATSTVSIVYPGDWSTKLPGSAQRPHLSTIDTLILAVRAAEFHARHVDGRTGEVGVRRVDIKAPSAPVEETLDRVPVTATLRSATPAGSTYDVRVASMRTRVELVHGGDEAADAAFEGRPSAYGSGFRRQSQQLGNLVVDVEAASASADVTVHGDDGPAVSLIDSFVVALQLGQILLYETDGIARSQSNTLWMRHTTLTAAEAARPAAPGPFRTVTTLEDSRLVENHGRTWRTATICGDCLGARTRCAVAHLIP